VVHLLAYALAGVLFVTGVVLIIFRPAATSASEANR
jgi:hypothetical protein